ncbi:exonuclease family protein [Escherichia coli]|uniref:Exonuclease family protein n=1 Tax=Escherichia coli TaxID=562 RepID=A0AAX2K966_ECOLX|nr:exonuclease family protein [Escherichia coli]
MSKVFICAAIPDEQAIKEEGAVAVATAIEAGDECRAPRKISLAIPGTLSGCSGLRL